MVGFLAGFEGSRTATAALFSPVLLLLVVVLGLLRMEGSSTVGEGDEAETRMVGVIPADGIDRNVGLDKCCFRSFDALSVGIGGFCCCCC